MFLADRMITEVCLGSLKKMGQSYSLKKPHEKFIRMTAKTHHKNTSALHTHTHALHTHTRAYTSTHIYSDSILYLHILLSWEITDGLIWEVHVKYL